MQVIDGDWFLMMCHFNSPFLDVHSTSGTYYVKSGQYLEPYLGKFNRLDTIRVIWLILNTFYCFPQGGAE